MYCSECKQDYDAGCDCGCQKSNNSTGYANQYQSIIEIINKSDIDESKKSKLLNDIELDYMVNWK